jgi:antitoxin VapB
MSTAAKARVFMNGRSQHVTIPAEFRFKEREVYVRRDPRNGDIILSRTPGSWKELFAAIDEAGGFPDDFMEDRQQGVFTEREEL